MAAAIEALDTTRRNGQFTGFPVKASTTLYAGTLLCLSASYAEPGTDATAKVFAGVADESVDNSAGADGDEDVNVHRVGDFLFASGSALAAGDEGKEVFIEDDQTVVLAADATNNVSVGHIAEIVDANTCWVAIKTLQV